MSTLEQFAGLFLMLRIFSALLRTVCLPPLSSSHSYTCNTYRQYFSCLDKFILGVSWDFHLLHSLP